MKTICIKTRKTSEPLVFSATPNLVDVAEDVESGRDMSINGETWCKAQPYLSNSQRRDISQSLMFWMATSVELIEARTAKPAEFKALFGDRLTVIDTPD